MNQGLGLFWFCVCVLEIQTKSSYKITKTVSDNRKCRRARYTRANITDMKGCGNSPCSGKFKLN